MPRLLKLALGCSLAWLLFEQVVAVVAPRAVLVGAVDEAAMALAGVACLLRARARAQ